MICLRKPSLWFLLLAGCLAGLLLAACGSSDQPGRLVLEWTSEEELTAAVLPSNSVESYVVVRNVGGAGLDAVSLRFNQHETGQLPVGVSVGTVTHVSSRFEGESQVWDLGSIGPGDTVIFPMTLWFEAASRTAEPAAVRLRMVAATPDLPAEAESNDFELLVDARQASGR